MATRYGIGAASADGEKSFGFDVDAEVVDGVNAGRSHIGDVSEESIAEVVRDGRLVSAATSYTMSARNVEVAIATHTDERGRGLA